MGLTINGVAISQSALIVLLCATLTTLSSGTNYVVASYAPQYADRLHLSSTQINLVAAAGNWGVYITGPPMGWVADRSGPRAIVLSGALLLGAGYFGLYYSFVNTEPENVSIPILAFWSFCTGLGSCAGNTAGLNAVAKSFAAETRGMAVGIVVAGYGLSAFVYATISGYISGNDTAAFLLILAIGTFSSLLTASIFLTPQRIHAASAPVSYAPVLMSPSSTHMFRSTSSHSRPEGEEEDDGSDDLEALKRHNTPPARHDIGGIGLFKSVDYFMLMLVTFCLTGTGLMWINSVGTIVVTLAQHNNIPGKASRLQSSQTSLLSILNCLGRLFIGFVSDAARTRWRVKPIWWLVFISCCFFISQWMGKLANSLSGLSWTVALLGASYGQFYGLAPLIMLDWYGLTHFSSNVGLLYTIPTFSSYTFSHLFGRIYDSHTSDPPTARGLPSNGGHSHICPLGKECYTETFTYTLVACALAVIVSFVLATRRGKKSDEDDTNPVNQGAVVAH